MPFPNSARDGTRVMVVFCPQFTIFTIIHFQTLQLLLFLDNIHRYPQQDLFAV